MYDQIFLEPVQLGENHQIHGEIHNFENSIVSILALPKTC